MKSRKPVWVEGLFITQHHFQQLDGYHESLLDERIDATVSFPWGIIEMVIDERALDAGQFKLTRFEAILPDGTPISCGEESSDVLQRDIGDAFNMQLRSLDVYVGVPRTGDGSANVDLERSAASATRYVREPRTVVDINSGRTEHTVYHARPNRRILFGSEPREGYDALRVATLVRGTSASVIVKSTSIPPVLRIRGSHFLVNGLQRLVEAMVTKQRGLASSRRQRSAAQIDFQASDAAKFWFLGTLNRYIPVLSHYLDQQRAHPEALYLQLASLHGELCTFAVQGDPTKIPKFNYLDLGETFTPLFKEILTLLETIVAERYVEVPLQRRDDGMYLGRPNDPLVFRHEVFVAARGSVPEGQLRERLPKLAKIASWSQVGSILNSAINGARLELEYTPPGALPVRPGTIYFRVTKTPEYWSDIQGSGTIAIYQPLEPRSVELSLFAIDPENL
jgi:type VI secretion system protein ImpJ